MEGLGSHSGVLGKSPGGVCVMLRPPPALSLVIDDSRDICLAPGAHRAHRVGPKADRCINRKWCLTYEQIWKMEAK